MRKLKLTQKEFNKLLQQASSVKTLTHEAGERSNDSTKYHFYNDVPTIAELKKAGIGPTGTAIMTKDILAFLLFYGGKEKAADGTEEYIYSPEENASERERRTLNELRKYIAKTIDASVEIVRVRKKGEKFHITEKDYNALVDRAAAVEARMKKVEAGEDIPIQKRFLYRDQLPTIEDLQKCNVGPYVDSNMSEDLLLYLIYLAEQIPVGKDEDGEDIYDYIYKPNPSKFSAQEMKNFTELRRYIEQTIQKSVEIVYEDD